MKRIRWWRRSLAVAALCLAIPTVLFLTSLDRGPRYQGKSARYWVGQLVRNELAARNALRELGPAAIPALIEAVRKRENAVVEALRLKLPNFVRRRFLSRAEVQMGRERAIRVLYDSGTNAAPAVPALIAVGDGFDIFNFASAGLAHATLLKIGETGVPQLIEVLQSKNSRAQEKAATYLGLIGPRASAAAPMLAEAVNDSSPAVRSSAVTALAQVGASAQAALPALRVALQRDDDYFRLQVIDALWKIGRESELVVPILIKVVSDAKNPNRARAVTLLGEIGPAARAAVPALTSVLREEFSYGRVKAEEALKEIDPAVAANKTTDR